MMQHLTNDEGVLPLLQTIVFHFRRRLTYFVPMGMNKIAALL